MLRLISEKPTNIIMHVDATFNSLKIGKHIVAVSEWLTKYTDISIINPEQVDANDIPENILVRGEFGKTNLSRIATGYKGMLLAYLYKLENKPFCCPEFYIGANVIPALVEIASDTDCISLWCPRLDLSQHYDLDRFVTVLADGKEKRICC